jgi:hypothetical protein
MGGIRRTEFSGPVNGDLIGLTANFLSLLENLHYRYANHATNNIMHRVTSFYTL